MGFKYHHEDLMRERQREIKYRYTEKAWQRRRQRRERCSHKPRNTAATGAGGDKEQILPRAAGRHAALPTP